MDAIPLGALFFAWCTLMAVVPFRRPRRLALASWISSAVPNEVPYLFLLIVVGSSVPTILDGELSLGRWISLALAAATSVGLLVVARRALQAGAVVERALADGLGRQWRREIDPSLATGLRRHLPWPRILFLPWMFGRHDVEHTADVPYDEDGVSNRLDVYRHRSRPLGAPTLVYLHGGGFRWGGKNREARPLLYHLASHGWTCISANYHLAPNSTDAWPHNLIDVKRIVAWVRTHGREHGADPHTIFLVGASAGAHLAMTAALTGGDPRFQPGFEDVDTSITAAVGLYGYYGELGDGHEPPSTPLAYAGDAPPCFVVHGDQDTYTPPEGARALVDHLRGVSRHPVVYAELPGAQHSFDLFHSVRFETVIDGIEAFAPWTRSTRSGTTADPGGIRLTPREECRPDTDAAQKRGRPGGSW